jgi:hypothetical protein
MTREEVIAALEHIRESDKETKVQVESLTESSRRKLEKALA